jgi:hypothetical protein
MALEARAPSRREKTPPHSAVLSQVERIVAHQSFRDHSRLPELLRYLVEINEAGRFDPPFRRDKPKPTGKLIVEEFYNHRFKVFMEDPPIDTALAGKKLVGQLRLKLKKYYGEHPDPKTHGRVRIVIPDFRGTAYRPQIEWLDGTPNTDANAAARFGQDNSTSASAQAQPGSAGLAAVLNARLAFLNDPEFGQEMERYFDFAASHGIYCHDLRTNFTFREVNVQHFPQSEHIKELASTCFEISIREMVDKVCAPEKIRFAVFLHPGFLAHHFVTPEVDFAWQIDLPREVTFDGKISEIFRIDLVEVDKTPIITGASRQTDQHISILRDDAEQFLFDVDTSTIPMHGLLRKLKYTFHTLKAKDYRFVSHGTRVLTRGMTIKVDFDPETGIQGAIVQPSFSGDESPRQSDFTEGEISVSGWLLPRSGATFSFRYDKPYR